MTNYAPYTEMQKSMTKVNNELIAALEDLSGMMNAETDDAGKEEQENLFRKFAKKISRKNGKR
jgi:hypothetical protein